LAHADERTGAERAERTAAGERKDAQRTRDESAGSRLATVSAASSENC
jgi:hypothetical protein